MPDRIARLAIVLACASLLAASGSAQAPLIASRKLAAPLPAPKSGLRVLIYHDMEGLAGEDDPNQFRFNHPDAYPKGQELLVADINTVVAGLYDGGATSVDVVDAHGSGNPEPDVRRDLLDKRAEQVVRDKPFRQYVDIVEPNKYDAVVAVGMHAKTGSRGFASHTYTIGMDIIMNGQPITESELVGYSWGRVGVPLIMVTGDDRLRADLKTMPWLEYVVTKRATSASTVELRPVDQVHADMRAAAKRALERRSQAKSMALTTPIRAALHAVPPASLEPLKDVPGINYHDNQVDFVAKDFAAAYDGVVGLIGVATLSYSRLMMEIVRARPDAKTLLLENADLLFKRWMDVESGRWTAPVAAAPMAGKKYHGAN
ncbi:MAG: M55 family metallopeptidase [Gemmatimonadota bacterium]